MLNKKTARLAACRLKGHNIVDELCWTCFFDYWAKQSISTSIETTKRKFLKKMEALDCK